MRPRCGRDATQLFGRRQDGTHLRSAPHPPASGEEVSAVVARGGYGLAPDDERGLAAGGRDDESGAGARREGQRDRGLRAMLQGYNSHGRVVLDGVSGAVDAAAESEAARARGREVRSSWVGLPDLEPAPAPRLQPLPPQLAPHGAAPLNGEASRGAEASTAARGEAAASGAPAPGEGIGRPETGERVRAFLGEAEREGSPFNGKMGEFEGGPAGRRLSREVALAVATGAAAPAGGGGEEGGVALPEPRLQSEINDFKDRTVELLRYFYACFPLAAHPGARERVPKLHAALQRHHAELDAFKKQLPRDSPEMGAMVAAVSRRVTPLQNTVSWALDHYDKEGRPA
uniref:Uncharacterized protein n=1 Tax=Emiliania huxleyi TaxID=2903 RepID=A0A6V2SAM1_EMIHU